MGSKNSFDKKIVITGGAGLLGQNTILLLRERGYKNIVAIDKHAGNAKILKELNPEVEVRVADISEPGDWQNCFENAHFLLLMHAQITSKNLSDFERNNVRATELVLAAAKKHGVKRIVHISSSVVVSVADDFYTNTKKEQDRLVDKSGIPYVALRPSLMFGFFDKKHIGWLSRFMQKTPVFPIPGSGEYLRQPLYAKDMAEVTISAMENARLSGSYNIIGLEDINYIDIIRTVKKVTKSKTIILKIPKKLFAALLDFYAIFSERPPFTSDQLTALTAGDYFESSPWQEIFSVRATPFKEAVRETFCDEKYSKIVLEP